MIVIIINHKCKKLYIVYISQIDENIGVIISKSSIKFTLTVEFQESYVLIDDE